MMAGLRMPLHFLVSNIPPPHQTKGQTYSTVLSIWAPQIGTSSRTEICMVSFRFMYPFPSKIPLEVNIKWSQTAVILHIPVNRMADKYIVTVMPSQTGGTCSVLTYSKRLFVSKLMIAEVPPILIWQRCFSQKTRICHKWTISGTTKNNSFLFF